MTTYGKKPGNYSRDVFFLLNSFLKKDELVRSHEIDDSLAELSQVMTKDEVQRSRWTFYEVVKKEG